MRNFLTDWYRKLRSHGEDQFDNPSMDGWELWSFPVRHVVRLMVVFLLLFAGVFAAFRWSGAAVRFGSQRVSGQATATWQVTGVVTDARTGQPVSWARVEDDPAGRPPFYFAEADQAGRYRLLTFAEAHRIRVSAPNYVTTLVEVGRVWFLWKPRGEEHRDLKLEPEANSTPR